VTIQGRVVAPQSRPTRACQSFAPEPSGAWRRGSTCSKDCGRHGGPYSREIMTGTDPYWAGGGTSPFFFKVADNGADRWFPSQDKGQNGQNRVTTLW
jgi:hypothetical protein